MITLQINYISVVVAAAVAHFLGALWFSPVLFGKVWMDLMGFTKQKMEDMKKKGMAKTYFLSFVGSLVTAWVLAYVIGYSKVVTSLAGISAGFWCWLGFVVPVFLGAVLWEAKSFKWFVLMISYYLVSLALMGAILAGWPAGPKQKMEAIAFAVPLLPGKTDAWLAFNKELKGPRQKEFAESRARMGVKMERTFLQRSGNGDTVVVMVKGTNVRNFNHMLGSSQDPFDIWFRQQVLDVHGFDLAKELPPGSEPVLDWKAP